MHAFQVFDYILTYIMKMINNLLAAKRIFRQSERDCKIFYSPFAVVYMIKG